MARALNSPWLDRWKIQLRTLSGGEPHPSARTADLCYDYFPEYCNSAEDCEMSLSITSSRIAFFCTLSGTPYITGKLIVWDWTTGDILVVRCVFLSRHPLMWTVFLGP